MHQPETLVESEEKINLLFSEGWSARFSDSKRALSLADSILKETEALKSDKLIAKGYLLQSAARFLSSSKENITDNLFKAAPIFERVNDEINLTRCYNVIGNIFDSYGDYAKAMEYCSKALKIAETKNFKEETGDILSTLGNIHFRLADYNSAVDCFQKSYSIREELGNVKAQASSLNLIGRTFGMLNDFENAFSFYDKSLQIRLRENDLVGLPWTYLGIAVLCKKTNNHDLALKHFNSGLDANSKTPDKRFELLCLIEIGRILAEQENFEKAISHYEKAMEIAQSLNAKPLLYEIHNEFANVFEKTGDLQKAIFHFKEYQKLKDEVQSADVLNRLKNQQIGFAVERSEKEAEIYRLKHVELKNAFDIIEEKNKHITDSISYASRIQKAILPSTEDMAELLPQSFLMYRPKDIVSGDFYWVSEVDDKIIVIVGDCTGHGVPGAFMSMIGTDQLNHIIYEQKIFSPALILEKMHQRIKRSLKQDRANKESNDGMEMAICIIDKKLNELDYSGAGRPLIYCRCENDGSYTLQEYKADKKSLGGDRMTEDETFTEHKLSFKKNDCLFLFSDGFQDQFDQADEMKFSSRRLKELLLCISPLSPEAQQQKAEETFDNWKGSHHQTDDVILFGTKF